MLGIERKLSTGPSLLQKRFYQLSRQLHPDRFTRRSAAEQRHSLEASSRLNDAYRTLRDPVERAEYVLAGEGFDIGEQRGKDVPPELLEEVFELNMALEELRSGDESQREALEEMRGRFEKMLGGIDAELAGHFKAWDDSSDRAVLERIRGVLNRRRYIRNLVRDVQRALQTS